jgi:Domain of unknown function (DUF4159)
MAKRHALTLCVAAAIAASAHYAYAQLWGGAPKAQTDQFKTDPEGFTRARFPPAEWPDRAFTICRLQYSSVRSERDGSGWKTDYPFSEINLLIRFAQLTNTSVSFDSAQKRPNTWVVKLTDAKLYDCPFLIASDVGTIGIKDVEVPPLREYLLKGGFLWVDDFWGTEAWTQWEQEIGKAFPPEEYPIEDVSAADPIMREMFDLEKVPQITNVTFWLKNNGKTSERDEDSAQVHVRAIRDRHRRIMVLMTHNTDVGDSFEREREDSEYSRLFSPPGYALGINVLLYAMTQ